ncbi:serine/threonine/tyrosine-interacting-like protein 1 [Gigantopelta aegis]|uniref:serine/threonine/tyrosine-interacting-like protein 1 n=1 Tax=Gigantopelta aegis TaxID=1735272 RepID=UPI001B88BF9A|nr:serine/threonine/tyrosine-interacting-like protein 1 [Gigantopelta aegis]
MEGLEFVEPSKLYNILQQATVFSCLSDPNYLLLIDARDKDNYNESHVITAKRAIKSENDEFIVPYDAELECKENIIVYDSNTASLKDQGPAVNCGSLLWDMGSRNTVKILKGGYEIFSALYPFLRTQKVLFMPREMDDFKPFPIEIIPGFLYLGNWGQANTAYIQKDLKIKNHINCCVELETFFPESGPQLLHIQVEDRNDADILSHFATACAFLDTKNSENTAVLVFSCLGISRSATVVMAYLIHSFKWTLEEAYKHVLDCSSYVRPNRGFIKQLAQWEEDVLGESKTNVDDPNF